VSTHASSICCAAGFGEFGESPCQFVRNCKRCVQIVASTSAFVRIPTCWNLKFQHRLSTQCCIKWGARGAAAPGPTVFGARNWWEW